MFAGPVDLAASMGYLGNPKHLDVQQVFDPRSDRQGPVRVRLIAMLAVSEKVKSSMRQGCRFVAMVADVTLLARLAEALLAQFC